MALHEIDASNFFFLCSYTNPTRLAHNETDELTGPMFVPPLLCFASHVQKNLRCQDQDSNYHPPDLMHDELDHRATVPHCYFEFLLIPQPSIFNDVFFYFIFQSNIFVVDDPQPIYWGDQSLLNSDLVIN